MLAQIHEEELTLDKETEGHGADEEKSVAVKLDGDWKSEDCDHEMVGGHTSEALSKNLKEATSGNEGLETNTPTAKIHPGALDISGATKDVVAIPPTSVTARIIEDLDLVSYPEGIAGPKQELNVNSKKGKFV